MRDDSAMAIFDRLKDSAISPYVLLADSELRLISIFDELKYDRSDADIISPAMRMHLVKSLQSFGFKQTSGTVLTNKEKDVRCLLPKFHALGASPFDITRHTKRRTQDYFALTPTQTAGMFIDHYPLQEAVSRIEALVQRQPINLFKLADFLEHKETHDAFQEAIGYLRRVQREAIESPALRHVRALG